jgi:hypothetical protein
MGIQYFNIQGDHVLKTCAEKIDEGIISKCTDHIEKLNNMISGKEVKRQNSDDDLSL